MGFNRYRWRWLLVPILAVAASAAAADFSGDRAAAGFIDQMVRDHGFKRAWLESVLQQAESQPSILKAIARPAEKTLTWGEYRKIFVTPERVNQGVAFWHSHREALVRAHQTYGVAPQTVVAIIGVETRYGRHRGRYRVIDALCTLAFEYPPRSAFFRKQLEQFLLLVREQGFDPLAPQGSYAGAMGYGQFIPSSYRHFAVDFDGDGVANILDDPTDAIGSVAHYFQAHGWRDGGIVAVRATPRAGADPALADGELKPAHTVAALERGGYRPERSLPGDTRVSLMKLDAADDPQYWLGLHNFYVITRYNHSPLYAMAVWQLGEEIRQAYTAAYGNPSTDSPATGRPTAH